MAYDAGLFPCGAAGTPDAIVRLAWDDFSGATAGTLVRVAYVRRAAPGQTTLTELHRLRCNGSAVVVSDVTLAHDLDPSAAPVVACSTTCSAAPSIPTTVTLTLTLKDPGNRGNPFVVPLTGQRRQS